MIKKKFEIAQHRAWEFLSEKEKTSLTLVLGHDRSRKEAAKIMEISPYKFIEIYLRARRFYLTFQSYYEFIETYPDFIQSLPISGWAYDFIDGLISSRKTITKFVYTREKYQNLITPEERLSFWSGVIQSLELSSSGSSKMYLELIKTYDSWNNVRILPRPFQDISPFPRKRNRIFKQVKKYVENITELHWAYYEKAFPFKNRGNGFVPKLGEGIQPSALKIGLTKVSFKYFTSNHIPIFATEGEAETLARLVFNYNLLYKKNSYIAKKFWVNFRTLVYKSLNYVELFNFNPGDFGDMPLKDKQFLQKIKSKPTRRPRARVTLSPSSAFYVKT